MDQPRIFVTRRITDEAVNFLRQHAQVSLWEDFMPPPRHVLLEEASRSQGLLTMVTDRIDAELLDAAPGLRVVSNMAVGYDNIDVAAATARRIPIGHTVGVVTEPTADITWALLLSMARRLSEGERYVHEGQWRTWHPTLLLGQQVHGATLGIVGFGAIGQAVARRALGFNMRVLYSGTRKPGAEGPLKAQHLPLDDLLRQSDFVSLHVPLKADTRGLIGARELALMKPSASLINAARGPVVDSLALYAALRDKRIAAAALDVTDPEPIRPDDPLLTLDNCLIIPHLGSATYDTRNQMGLVAARNALAGARGERLLYCVNPEVYTH